MKLEKHDLAIILAMRAHGVLEEVAPHKLDPKGVIILACGDCDRFPDIFRHKMRMFRKTGRRRPRPHTLALNGGALRLALNSPANKRGRSTANDLIDEIAEAKQMKGLDVLALYIHWPCGKAKASKISFLGAIHLLFAAKRHVKTKIKNLKVACFVHIEYSQRKMRTYFVSQKIFAQWVSAGLSTM